MFKYLLEKEFKFFIRHPVAPKLVIALPLMIMLLFPYAANMEVKDIKLAVIDSDRSAYSHRLIEKVTSSGHLELISTHQSYEDARKSLDKGDVDIILEFERGFERNLTKEGVGKLMVSSNAINAVRGGLSASYLGEIIVDYSMELNEELHQVSQMSRKMEIKTTEKYLFNSLLDYKVFMVPALMVMLITILSGFLPATNIVTEKESGTIEQMNVTPVKKLPFILSKLIPYWLVGFVAFTICVVIAAVGYKVYPVGSLLTLYFFVAIYTLVVSTMGLVVSNYSATLQQAALTMFFFLIVFILMSGLFTPISSMPEWAQTITHINPLKYFMRVMRMIYLKGSGFVNLLPEFFALVGFTLFFGTWAVLSYKKNN